MKRKEMIVVIYMKKVKKQEIIVCGQIGFLRYQKTLSENSAYNLHFLVLRVD